jgi:hypothetical protein
MGQAHPRPAGADGRGYRPGRSDVAVGSGADVERDEQVRRLSRVEIVTMEAGNAEMTPPFISGGTVEYSERRRMGDFEHREVKVVLSFSTCEGDHRDILRQAATAAQTTCIELHRQAVPVKTTTMGRPPGTKNKMPAVPHLDMATVRAQLADDADDVPAEELAPRQEAVKEAVKEVSTAGDGIVDDVNEAKLPDITDKELQEATARHNQKLVTAGVVDGTKRIKELIYMFVGGPPKRTGDIPQSRRREFLAKLEGIK